MAPRLIALLACQEISPDEGDTITLHRVVSSIAMSSFPGTVGGHLFIRVADLEGDHAVRLEMRDSDRGVTVTTPSQRDLERVVEKLEQDGGLR